MKKKQFFIRTWCVVLLLLGCNISYAASFGPLGDFFKIAQNDESVKMLSSVFGKVGGVLGTEQALLGNMFKIFNEAMMALATIIIIYTTVVSIVNTAHQGQFLGKSFDSMWMPLRTIAGYALIIPTASGYSMIQIFMMWVVLQGVGAADTVWNTVIDYFNKGNTAVIVPITSTGGNVQIQAQNILYSTLCFQRAVYQSYAKPEDYNGSNVGPTPVTQGVLKGYSFKTNTTPQVDCGTILWPDPSRTNFIANPNLSDEANSENSDIFHRKLVAMNSGFTRMVADLNTAAINYTIAQEEEHKLPEDINPIYATVKYFNDQMNDITEQYATRPSTTENMWDYAKNDGWVFAGSYFHYIASLNNSVGGFSEMKKVKYTDGSGGDYKTAKHQNFVNYLFSNSIQISATKNQANESGFMSADSSSRFHGLFLVATKWIVPVFNWMLTGKYTTNFPGSSYMANKKYNPIIRIQILGNRIVQVIETLWTELILMSFTFVLLTAVPFVGGAFANIFNFIKSYILTPIMWIFFLMLATGLSMAVYIPLIPYIIFTFTVIGWLIAVAETMLAAPMVALGLTHPTSGSHEIFGRAEPALMMLANVFIRPTLMLFGLFSAMILSYVAVEFVNMGFMSVVNSVASGFSSGATKGASSVLNANNIDPLELCMFLVVYVSLIIAILNRCFSLIHIFPDRILKWIGYQSQFGEYAGSEKEVESGFKSAAPSAERGMRGVGDRLESKVSKKSQPAGKGRGVGGR